jgi:hypothetical protein
MRSGLLFAASSLAMPGDHQRQAKATEPMVLAGLLVDSQGERLTPSHAVKKGRRYRHYISAALITEAGADRTQSWRLAAREIEDCRFSPGLRQ